MCCAAWKQRATSELPRSSCVHMAWHAVEISSCKACASANALGCLHQNIQLKSHHKAHIKYKSCMQEAKPVYITVNGLF